MFKNVFLFSRKQSPMTFLSFIIGTTLILSSCSQVDSSSIYNLPAFNKSGNLQAVIEIPAGTNKKIEFDTQSKTFQIDQRDGKDRVIQYLSYPANYGFVPGTFSDPQKGGDGDALDILIICEAIPTSKVIEVIPLGMFKLLDEGELDYKIIAIPKDQALQTVKATSFAELNKKYSNLPELIAIWFMNYDTGNNQESLGWGDEIEAMKEINSQLKPVSK